MTSYRTQYFTWSASEQTGVLECLSKLEKLFTVNILDLERNYYEVTTTELNLTETGSCIRSYYIHTIYTDGVPEQKMFVITKLDKIMLPISLILFAFFVMMAVYTNLAYGKVKVNQKKNGNDGCGLSQAGSQVGSEVNNQVENPVGGQVGSELGNQVESQDLSSPRSPKGTFQSTKNVKFLLKILIL